jgi:F-type H+-transporting ATPase subunit delta
MRGASKDSFAAGAQALADAVRSGGADGLGAELFSVARLLDSNGTLRRALTDPSRPGQAKSEMVEHLLGGKVSDQAMKVVSAVAAGRWSGSRDLPDALDELSVQADVAYADEQGKLDDLEDELFRLERVVARERELADKLGDRNLPLERRQELLHGLLDGKADATTIRLAERAVAGRGRSFAGSLTAYQTAAAAHRNASIATVRVATDLSEAERTRLAEALSRQYGRAIQVNVVVDPSVIGGVRVDIGDEVIDGTVAAKLGDAERRIAG